MNLKMQSYMCVLSLMVDNYLVDASAMATDMNVATSKYVSRHCHRFPSPLRSGL
jgi:hypothetical protein